MVRILVFDDHIAVRQGTKSFLEEEEEFVVTFFDPPFTNERIETFDFSNTDVILMDMNLGEDIKNGIELSKKIIQENQDVKIVIYTGYHVSDYWDEAIGLGFYGVLSKSDSKEKVIDYIHHVNRGEIVVNFKEFQRIKLISEGERSLSEAETKDSLITEREKAILIEVEKGLTNQEIADILHLSKRSIEYSLTNIYNKLNISTRTEAVLIAKSEGIID